MTDDDTNWFPDPSEWSIKGVECATCGEYIFLHSDSDRELCNGCRDGEQSNWSEW